MNVKNALIAVVILLVITTFFYQQTESRKIQASLVALAKDRDSLSRQVSSLNQRIAETKARETAPSTAAEVPRAEPAAPPPIAQREEEPPTPGVTRSAPAGWMKNGKNPGAYVVGVDTLNSFAGTPSAYVKSVEPSVDGFGGMMQMTSAEEHIGKRIRLSGWVKTEDANDGGGHLWLRVDGKQGTSSLQFDNMDSRPVKGTTDWQQYSVVLDVPPEAGALAYGFFVSGTGKMWVNGAKIEPVGPEVPSTNMYANRAKSLPKTPVNLNFDPNHPK